jgi:thioesterase domain-containing protein
VTDELLDAATRRLAQLIPVMGTFGVRVVDVAPGRVATEVPLEGNQNHIGTMYAGVLFSVAEVLGGVIATATFDGTRFYPLVKGVDIRYLKPARTAVRAATTMDEETIGRVLREAEELGKSDYVLEVTVTDEEGTAVARTRGDYQLRRRESTTG